MTAHAPDQNWARLIVEELILQGVGLFCICPGSRSTPLTLAVATVVNPCQIVSCLDERSAAFQALGYVLASQKRGQEKLAAVIVTSGSAVGNLVPAVMEAHHAHLPIVLLSADRPEELRVAGANQTTDQVKLFASFVNYQIDLPLPSPGRHPLFPKQAVAQALLHAKKIPRGPVHLNLMVREPSFSDADLNMWTVPSRPAQVNAHFGSPTLNDDQLSKLAYQLTSYRRGIIYVARADPELQAPLHRLSQQLGWPIIAEILSPLRRTNRACVANNSVIQNADLLLKALLPNPLDHKTRDRLDPKIEQLLPEAILQIGTPSISKALLNRCFCSKLTRHLQLTADGSPYDPGHTLTDKLFADPLDTINQWSSVIAHDQIATPSTTWQEHWQSASFWTRRAKRSLLDQLAIPTEMTLFGNLAQILPPRLHHIWLSNSSPIYLAETLVEVETPDVECMFWANRGLSGIDGSLSTPIGLALALQQPLLVLVGDLSFLYDMNALLQLEQLPLPPITFLVVDNGGGAIFSRLPTHRAPDPIFTRFFLTPQTVDLKKLAEAFKLHYSSISTLAHLKRALHVPNPICHRLLHLRTATTTYAEHEQTLLCQVRELILHDQESVVKN